jgi:hypothetical protein
MAREIEYVKVDGHPFLYKDPLTNTFINTNSKELESARNRKKNHLARKAMEEQREEEVSELKNEISELKAMVKELIEKN